jgi:hypothetical protein
MKVSDSNLAYMGLFSSGAQDIDKDANKIMQMLIRGLHFMNVLM